MTEDAVLVEGDALLAREIGLDPRPGRDSVTERDDARNLRKLALHRLRKGVGEALDHLEERQVGRRKSRADQMRLALRVALKDRLEPVEEFRNAALAEQLRPAERLRLLVLVVEVAAERMVGVVRLDHDVGDGELDLVCPEAPDLALRREPVLVAEIEEDVGRLADHLLSVPQVGRREGGGFTGIDVTGRAALAPDIDVGRARLLQRQADEFAAALDRGPIIELVGHSSPPIVVGTCVFRALRAELSRPAMRIPESHAKRRQHAFLSCLSR